MKTKTSLYNFVDKKVNAQQKELNSQIESLVAEKVEPILTGWVRTSHLENLAQKFVDALSESLEEYKIFNNWDRQGIISNINSRVVSIGHQIRDKVLYEMKVCAKEGSHYGFQYDPLDKVRDELHDAVKPVRKKLSDLERLKKELHNAIAKEHNGERAYKALIALGVDMTDYEESGENLPAVVKLSVDPCLINGNCNDKSA